MSRAGGSAQVPSAEVLGLYAGLRRAWRLRLPDRELAAWRVATERRGWTFAVAEHAVDTAPGGHGMREGQGASRHGPSMARLVIVGRDRGDVALALALETEALAHPSTAVPGQGRHDARLLLADLHRTDARHRALGELYGYPACCVQAFSDAHLEVLLGFAPRLGDNLAAIVRSAERSGAFEPLLDTLDGGAFASQRSPLRHLPCRFDCPSSLLLAQKLVALAADVQRDIDPAADPARATGSLAGPTELPADDVIVLADGRLVRVRVAAAGHVSKGHWPAAWVVAVDSQDPALVSQLPVQSGDRQTPFGDPLALTLEPGVGLRWFDGTRERSVGAATSGPWAARLPLALPFASGAGG